MNRLRRKPTAIPIIPAPEEEDNFVRFVRISAVLHLGLLALFTLRAVLYPTEPLVLERAIRVDMVALPDKQKELPPELVEPVKQQTKSEPKAEATPVPPKPKDVVKLPDTEAKKPEAEQINLKQTKKSQDAALKRLEAMQKIEKMMKEDNNKKVVAARHDESQPSALKGNEVSPGTALTGLAKIENERYLVSLDEHVKKHWNLPNFLATAKLNASVIVFLDEHGNILKKKMVKSSGNQIFDQTVMESIERASPFPAPPHRLANLFMVDGIQLGFPE